MINRLTTSVKMMYKGILYTLIPALFIFSSAVTKAQTKGVLESNENLIKEINLLFNSNKWEDGKKMADFNLRKSPKDSDLRMLVGKYYNHKKNYEKARYELNKSIQFNENNVEAKHLLVGVEMETKRYSSAICFVNELLEVQPYWRGLWRKKIELNRLQGNHVEAERLLKRISQIFPEDKNIQNDKHYQLEVKANAYQKADKMELAIELKRNLLENNPDNQNYYIDLVDAYIKAGDDANAMVFIGRGLIKFPLNRSLINKNIGLLENQNRYNEILRFIQLKRSKGLGMQLKEQYDYYLLEAARSAKNSNPAELYGKVFMENPGNEEAFNFIYNGAIQAQQYDQALFLLNRRREIAGDSKELLLKELNVYKLAGNKNRALTLSRNLHQSYPADSDLKDAYLMIVLKEAKENMQSKQHIKAIDNWMILLEERVEFNTLAKNGLYTAYEELGQHEEALFFLNELVLSEPDQIVYAIKLADNYYKLNNYEKALSTYERLLENLSQQKKNYYLSGYRELMGNIIKDLLTKHYYRDALAFTIRWLENDESNELAFQHAINLSHRTEAYADMFHYASMANATHPDNTWFKVKLADAMMIGNRDVKDSWLMMKEEIELNPFHEEVRNTFSQISLHYGKELLKENKNVDGLSVAHTGLSFDLNNKELKYLKGMAFEKMKVYDSAYYYQSYYEPGYLERRDFKQHLYYLNQKASRNEIAIHHLRSRLGENAAITSISSVEYSRLGVVNSYVARMHYAGRETGRGLQGQIEWSRVWTEGFYTKFDLALSDRYFPKLSTNLSLYKNFFSTWEGELGLGYRRLDNSVNLSNVVMGITKEIEHFRINTRFNQFFLEDTWLFNLSTQARYYMNSPKNYLLAMASLGSSPDVELLDRQFYDSFALVNTMVGLGMGHSLTKNVSTGVLGTWYNFQTEGVEERQFKNLYHLNFHINVAF